MKMQQFVVVALFVTLAHSARRARKESNSSVTSKGQALGRSLSRSHLASKAKGHLKKGFCIAPTSRLQCEDLSMLKDDTYGWWYSWRQAPVSSWNKSQACEELLEESHFVPMIKNNLFTKDDQLSETYMKSQYLLGFNEPYGSHDHKKTGEKEMTPEQAVEGMKIVIGKAESVNPSMQVIAPTVNPKAKAMEWYKQFHDKAVDAGIWSKFKAINVHSHKCDAMKLMKKLKQVYDTFGLPIWLTEFNCNGAGNPKTTAAEHLAFMKEILPMLEAAPYVARYAWYAVRNTALPNANLAEGVGQREGEGWVGELTELGRYYNAFVPAVDDDQDDRMSDELDDDLADDDDDGDDHHCDDDDADDDDCEHEERRHDDREHDDEGEEDDADVADDGSVTDWFSLPDWMR